MSLTLYAHPFSSYCQKVLIALYENATAFEFRTLPPDDSEMAAELRAMWPFGRIPVLVDDRRAVVESSIIIEHLDLHHPGPVRMVPANDRAGCHLAGGRPAARTGRRADSLAEVLR